MFVWLHIWLRIALPGNHGIWILVRPTRKICIIRMSLSSMDHEILCSRLRKSNIALGPTAVKMISRLEQTIPEASQ